MSGPKDAAGLRVAIVMASAGRAELLGQALDDLLKQSYPVAAHVVSVPDEDSLPRDVDPTWQVVSGSRGLTAQRNAGLDALHDIDVVFFFDDDAVVHNDYISAAVDYFTDNPQCLAITGTVLADGVITGEIDRDPALELVRRWRPSPNGPTSRPSRTLFGANFAIRIGKVPDLRFDERLVLYSWLEDHDVARRLGAVGDLAKISDAVIVHRGASSGGRTNHLRLGYSQIMNPVYLHRKGSFPVWLTAWEIFRPTAKNVVYAFYGPQRSWRRVRLAGNARAVGDACRGRITPERIVQF
ncbi:hypothetical protein AZH51_13825 [Branchiibius sp. NY16-3462-2]|nr:hypothetical protein AZH51_13825 [Branchiibius sp. NY16-3462-2]